MARVKPSPFEPRTRFCHDAVILAGGRVLASGTTTDVLTSERLTAAFGVTMVIARIGDIPVIVPKGNAP